MQTAIRKHLFSISDFYRMAERGLFDEDARIELIDGEIMDMAPIGSRHAGIVSFLAAQLIKQLGDRAILRIQDPIHLGDLSAPQPDLAIVKTRQDFYRNQHPGADDINLLVEVADSTVHYDLTTKIPLYAKFAIPECWLADINNKTVTCFTEPHKNSYRTQQSYRADATAISTQFTRISINLRHLFD